MRQNRNQVGQTIPIKVRVHARFYVDTRICSRIIFNLGHEFDLLFKGRPFKSPTYPVLHLLDSDPFVNMFSKQCDVLDSDMINQVVLFLFIRRVIMKINGVYKYNLCMESFKDIQIHIMLR